MDTTPITAQDDKDVLILTIEMPFRGITTTVTVPAIEVAMGEVFVADQGGKYSSVIDMIIKHLKESLINPINQTYGHRTPLFADVVAAYQVFQEKKASAEALKTSLFKVETVVTPPVVPDTTPQ